MSLEHALLGFLTYSPLSGYDLKRVFDQSISHFWPADQSQIYRTLARLAKQGHVDVEVVPQDGKPNRKVYHLTDLGRAEFRRWLTGSLEPKVIREPFLIHIFFAGLLSDEEAVQVLSLRRLELQRLIAEYERVAELPLEESKAAAPARDQFFWFLTLDDGYASIQAALQWTESAIERIRNKDYEGGRDGALSWKRRSR